MVEITIILKLIIVVIILVIASVLFTTYMPSATQQAIDTVTSFTPEVELQSLPCSYYCLATKTPEELAVLESSDDISRLDRLPTYFTCNYQMLEFAVFAFELGKYHQGYAYAIIDMDNDVYFNDDKLGLYIESPYGGSICWRCASNSQRAGYIVYNDSLDQEQYIHDLFRKYIGWEVVDWNDADEKKAITAIIKSILPSNAVEDYIDDLDSDYQIILKTRVKTLKNYIPYDFIQIPHSIKNLDEVTHLNSKILTNYLAKEDEYAHVAEESFEDSVKLLTDCFNNTDLCEDTLSLSKICQSSPYLNDYHYISCLNPLTLKDRVSNFRLINRNGTDLYNDYVCVGNDFDACNVEMGKYGDDCLPAWATLITKAGRCEDIAVFYYTALRTLGVGDKSTSSDPITVGLETGVCDLPCPCKELVEKCGLKKELIDCKAHSRVIVEPTTIYGVIDVCPDGNGSTFKITSTSTTNEWLVSQHNDDYYADYYFMKSFDNYDANDEYSGEINDGFSKISFGGHSLCESYFGTFTKEELIERCSNFIQDPTGFDEIDELALCFI